MQDLDGLIYGKAQRIAFMAMGKTETGFKRDRRWKANDDPLAFCILTEAIYDLATEAQKSPPE